jgi:hypothetical protein
MGDEDDDWFLLLYIIYQEEEEQQEALSFRDRLHNRSRQLRSGTIRRRSLHAPSQSAFQHLYNSRQDDALVTLCGFDHQSFASLHALFVVPFENYSPYSSDGRIHRRPARRRRRRLITSVQCLALVLAWTRTRGQYAVLQLIFGFTKAHLSLWLRFGRRVLTKILRNNPHAQVRIPTDEEIAEFEAVITEKYPALEHCWGAMDGLKLRLGRSGNDQTQNMFFNGWTHDHYVSNLFLFSPDGKIRASYINAPGTFHDSTMANMSGIYNQIDDVYHRLGSKVVVDSAFSGDNRQSLYKSHQHNMDQHGNIRQQREVHRQATSVRQLSEWGMRGLQGSFPRLKDRLIYEERGERRIILEMLVLLYNYRASTVGINQIQSTYMPYLARSANDLINY